MLGIIQVRNNDFGDSSNTDLDMHETPIREVLLP